MDLLSVIRRWRFRDEMPLREIERRTGFQFDWSKDWAVLGGERVKLQAAHTKLSHSKAFIVRAYACARSGRTDALPR